MKKLLALLLSALVSTAIGQTALTTIPVSSVLYGYSGDTRTVTWTDTDSTIDHFFVQWVNAVTKVKVLQSPNIPFKSGTTNYSYAAALKSGLYYVTVTACADSACTNSSTVNSSIDGTAMGTGTPFLIYITVKPPSSGSIG